LEIAAKQLQMETRLLLTA